MKSLTPAQKTLLFIFSLLAMGGWLSVIFIDYKYGHGIAAIGHLGQVYFFNIERKNERKNK